MYAFVDGFAVGIILPFFEFLYFVLATSFIPTYQIMHISTAPIDEVIALVFIGDLIRNVVVGIMNKSAAFGDLLGTTLILSLAFGVFYSISPEGTLEVILLFVALAASLVIGVVLTFLRWRNQDDNPIPNYLY